MFVSGYPDISDYPCHMCMIKYLSGPLHMIMGCFFFLQYVRLLMIVRLILFCVCGSVSISFLSFGRLDSVLSIF